MSEEKLYVVKNDEGKYWDIAKYMPPWWNDKTGTAFKRIDIALVLAKNYDGHVVTFIEEPEKVVLTKKQAEIVKNAHEAIWPATCISGCLEDSSEQRLLIEAYVNGYTVAKGKKYNVKVPRTKDTWYYEAGGGYLRTICPQDKKLHSTFTESEIEHYGLQDCEKEEVTDDEQ